MRMTAIERLSLGLLVILSLGLAEEQLRAQELAPRPAGFAVWARTVPSEWDKPAVPSQWKRASLSEDPWARCGKINTAMPPLAASDTQRGYVVFARHYADQVVLETAPTREELAAPLEAFACPGEYEPVSFCVRALTALKDVAVEVSPLKGPAGSLPANHLDLRIVRNLPIPFGDVAAKTYALRPLLLEQRAKVDIAAETTLKFWLTIKVPQAAAPGLYTGTVLVQPSGRPAASMPLRLRVLPIKLEKPSTAYAFYHLLSKEWKHYGHDQPDTLRRHSVDMAEHGMNSVAFYTLPRIDATGGVWQADCERPANPYPHSFAQQLQAYREAGLTQRMVWYLGDLNLTLKPHSLVGGTPEMQRAYTAAVRQVEAWRVKQGFPAIFYSPHDEIDASADRTKDALFYLRTIKDLRVPTLQTYIGMKDRRQESLPLVDAACFAGDAFRAEFVEETKRAGKELWVYSGNARYGLDPKGDRYFFGLFAIRSRADGVSQWAYQWPPGTRGDASPYDMLAAGAQGWNYAFPATDGLLPSIGLEGIREGIDDAKYVYTLRQSIARARQSGKPTATQLADAAEERLTKVLGGIDINEKNVHFLDDFAKYTAANEQTCHKQPDAMVGADFDRLRWGWAQDILALQQVVTPK